MFWDQLNDLAIEEYRNSLPWDTFGLLLQYALGYYPFAPNCCLISFSAFDWIWAKSLALYTSQFILLLQSTVTSSIHTSDPVQQRTWQSRQLAAIRAQDIVSSMFDGWCASDYKAFLSFSIPSFFFKPKKWFCSVFYGLSGLLVLLSWSMHSFFWRMSHVG